MFWAPCGSGEGAGGWGASGGMGGVPHTCTCMHLHTHAHLYMYRNCKWPPTWRHPCLSCLACLTCMCMHVCMGHPPHTHTHPSYPHPPICHPPRGVDPRNHLKFNNTSTYQDISIPFENLNGWVCGLVGGWVDGWGRVKSVKI